ncbi:hypothetical protein FF38_03821, partial [Lucilia cuprina]
MIYVSAAQQDLHFQQFFKILELMGNDWASKLQHINYGMVQGMSTRKGTVVFLDTILEETKEAMHEVMRKNEAKYAQIEDPERVADLVGLSAIMIQDMQSKRVNNYTFDWKRMLSFEGDTGPYLQYAHSRLCSMERVSGLSAEDYAKANFDLLVEPAAQQLVRLIAMYPDTLQLSFHIVKPQLKLRVDGSYKIVQLSDLHLSTGRGTCDHVSELLPQQGEECRADLLTTNFVKRVLDLEKPDLVVYSGDLIFGQQSKDSETALMKALSPALERQIPFAVIWGNHDRDGNLDNHELMKLVESLPYSVSSEGPEEVKGSGNYALRIMQQNYPAISLYFLDSHTKFPKTRIYEAVDESQVEFLKQETAKTKQLLDTYPHIPLGMAFLHVPLPDYHA